MRFLLFLALAACKQDDKADTDTDTDTDTDSDTDTDADTDADSDTDTDTDGTTVTVTANLVLTVDADMALMIHAAWDDAGSTESWIEYRFEGKDWLVAPSLELGEGVILGIPAETDVDARAVMIVNGVTQHSEIVTAQTGALPAEILTPAVTVNEPALQTPAPFVMMSVASGDFPYAGPYYVQIMDRTGRIVWYHKVPFQLFSLYPSVSFDGTHIWYEGEDIFGYALGEPQVTRQTLDGRWEVTLPVPPLGQAIAEGPNESFYFEHRKGDAHGIDQIDAAGVITEIWDCTDYFDSIGIPAFLSYECELNSCLWDASRNTLMASQFYTSTLFEIDIATGSPLRQMGQLVEGDPYTFDPPESVIAYQHYPHLTPEGTLFVSTHVTCPEDEPFPECNDYYYGGQFGIQRAAEYAIDDVTKTLTLLGYYETDDIWAAQAGEAYRLPNDNIVQGYGQNGAVSEVTSAGVVAWHAQFETYYGIRAVGHASFIEDLYALNVGL